MAGVRRLVCWYQKESPGTLVGEAELRPIPLSDLQRIFGVPANNPMYDCWLVGDEQVVGLAPFLSVPLDFRAYNYYVEADAAE